MTTTYASGFPRYFQSNLEPGELPHPADPLFGTIKNHDEYVKAVDNYLKRVNIVIHAAWCVIKVLASQGAHGLIGRVVLLIFKSGENISNASAGHPISAQ